MLRKIKQGASNEEKGCYTPEYDAAVDLAHLTTSRQTTVETLTTFQPADVNTPNIIDHRDLDLETESALFLISGAANSPPLKPRTHLEVDGDRIPRDEVSGRLEAYNDVGQGLREWRVEPGCFGFYRALLVAGHQQPW